MISLVTHAISGNHILENADWDSIAGGSITPGAVLNAGDLIGIMARLLTSTALVPP